MNDLRDTLKNARLQAGITPLELSKMTNLHVQQVRNWEIRACYPPKDALAYIAEALDLDVDEVINQYLAEKHAILKAKK